MICVIIKVSRENTRCYDEATLVTASNYRLSQQTCSESPCDEDSRVEKIIHTHTYTYTHMCIYMYIYIYIERERDRYRFGDLPLPGASSPFKDSGRRKAPPRSGCRLNSLRQEFGGFPHNRLIYIYIYIILS